MWRCLFNLVCALSLVLLVASGLMWLRSSAAIDWYRYATAVGRDQRLWYHRGVYGI